MSSAPTPAAAPIPNNLGPTLLIIAGLSLTPALVGIPILWLGLSQLRDFQGRRSFPW